MFIKPPIKVQIKRRNRRIKSLLKKKLRNGGTVSVRQLKFYRINKHNIYRNVIPIERKVIEMPAALSFFDDANKTMDFINTAFNFDRAYRLFISYKETKHIGVAESFLFSAKFNDYRNKYNLVRLNGIAGRYSDSKEINNFLLAFGLLKELGITTKDPKIADYDYDNKFLSYKKTGYHFTENLKDETHDNQLTSNGLVDYFDKCLEHNYFPILDEAKQGLSDIFGEIIGNVEEHSHVPNPHWHTIGCYNKITHICSFAIINKGRTFYETLSNTESTAKNIIEHIGKRVDSNRTILQKIKGTFTRDDEEVIWNIMAIQQGISSKRNYGVGENSSRGLGITDFLFFIDKIKVLNTGKINIISGHSCLKIDFNDEMLQEIEDNGDKQKIVYFNKEKDLFYPPDSNKYEILKNGFKGVIFSGEFQIKEEFLQKNV